MDDLISRSHLIESLEKAGIAIPAWLRGMIESEPSAELEVDPCDFCKHNDDCGYMRAYCPAERKEE